MDLVRVEVQKNLLNLFEYYLFIFGRLLKCYHYQYYTLFPTREIQVAAAAAAKVIKVF